MTVIKDFFKLPVIFGVLLTALCIDLITYMWENKNKALIVLFGVCALLITINVATAQEYNVTVFDDRFLETVNTFTLQMSPSYLFTQDLTVFYPLSNTDTTASGGVVDLRSGLNGSASGYTVNDGVVSSGVTINETTGAMVFDGSTGFINVGSSAYSFGVADAFTVEAWVKRSGSGSFPIVGVWGTTSGVRNWVLWYQSGGQYRITAQGGGTAGFSSELSGNDLVHLVAVHDGAGNVDTYANGDYVASAALTFNAATQNLWIGRLSTTYATGDIYDVRIYDAALTAEDISSAYDAGVGSYAVRGDGLVGQYSGRDSLGTPASPTTILDKNMVVSTGFERVPLGWYFTRANSNRVVLDDIPEIRWNKSFSIGGAFILTSNTDQQTLFSQTRDSDRFTVQTRTVGGLPQLRVAWNLVGEGSGLAGARSSAPLELNQVYFWGYNYYGDKTGDLFIQGVSGNIGTNAPSTSGSVGTNIGSVGNPAFFFNGSILYTFYSGTILSSDEWLSLYNDGAGMAYPFSKPSENVSTTSGVVSLFVPDGYGIEQDLTVMKAGYFSTLLEGYSFDTQGNIQINITPITYFTVTLNNSFDNTSIQQFSVETINTNTGQKQTFSTMNGEIVTDILNIAPDTYDITIKSQYFETIHFLNYDVNDNLNAITDAKQIIDVFSFPNQFMVQIGRTRTINLNNYLENVFRYEIDVWYSTNTSDTPQTIMSGENAISNRYNVSLTNNILSLQGFGSEHNYTVRVRAFDINNISQFNRTIGVVNQFEPLSAGTALDNNEIFTLLFIYALFLTLLIFGQRNELINAFFIMYGLFASVFVILLGVHMVYYLPLILLTVYGVSKEFN